MADWYRTMSDLRHGDDAPGIFGGAIGISSRTLRIILVIVILLWLFHALRLWTGSVSWLGFEERGVRGAPEWMHTPVSTNTQSDRFGLSFPLLALEGQEIVVQYKLSSRRQNTGSPYAGLLVSCSCPVKNWHHVRIEHPGSGEIAMPVTRTGFYSFAITQSTGPAGEASVGAYYWGLRSPVPPVERAGGRTWASKQ